MKRAFAFIVCTVMLIVFLPVFSFAVAPYQFTITPVKTELVPGEEVKFNVTVNGTEDCDTIGLLLDFDRDVFELVKGTCNLIAEDEDGNDLIAAKLFSTAEGKEGFAVSFLEKVTYSGRVGSFTLKVKEGVDFGTTTVTCTPSVKCGSNSLNASVDVVTLTQCDDPTIPSTEPAEAPYQFTLTADKTEVIAGEEIRFDVTVKGTENCNSFGLMLSYDTSVFEVIGGRCTASYFQNGEDMIAAKTFSRASGKEGFAVSFLDPVVYSGNVGYIELKVKENVNFDSSTIAAKSTVRNGVGSIDSSANEVVIREPQRAEIDNILWYYTLSNNQVKICSVTAAGTHDVTVPEAIAGFPVVTIGSNAFTGNTDFNKVIIPENVTCIEKGAFQGCEALSAVTIPASVATINEGAFFGCSNLQNVYYAAAKSKWSGISIGENNTCLTNASIHYNHVHDYTMLPPASVSATCTQEGYIEYVCAYDPDDTYRVHTSALGHDYSRLVEKVESTCLEDGYSVKACSRCEDKITTDYVDALGHDYSSLVEKVEPNCLEGGYSIKACSRCEDKITTDYVDALGHDYSSLVEKVDPTCTEDGYSVYSCLRCKDRLTTDYVDAMGHHAILIPVREATCTEEGVSRAGTMCDRCQIILVSPEIAPALGHNYIDGYCSVCREKAPVGDLTNDGVTDNNDIILLMWYILFPEQYPLSTSVDINSDGQVDNNDVITLMWYVLFPEQYPL